MTPLWIFVSAVVAVGLAGSCTNENCRATTGLECNGRGNCTCGTCSCVPGYSGPTCEECATCPSPCEVYRDCVSCKWFLTGRINHMECLQVCDRIVTIFDLDRREFEEFGEEEGMTRCARINEKNCRESFKVGAMTDGWRDLYVLAIEECDIDLDTTTAAAERTTATATTAAVTTTTASTITTTEATSTEDMATATDWKETTQTNSYGGKYEPKDPRTEGEPEDAGSVSGSSKGQDSNRGAGLHGLDFAVFLSVMFAILALTTL